MAFPQERRASRLILLRKGRGIWVLALMAAVLLLLVLSSGNPEGGKNDLSFRSLASFENVGKAMSVALAPSAEKLPEPLQIRIETLFSEITKHPESKEGLLRELKRVLQQNFKGQEDCWSCPGSEYFDRFDAIAGAAESRKPMGLKDWIALGDEAFDRQRWSEAREDYSEALHIMDERVFQPDENIDTTIVDRLNQRCQQLNCR